MNWKFEWITDWNTIYSEAFQQKWLAWYNQAENSHVFSHPALGMAWLETYRPIRNTYPLFSIATKGNSIVFMPMISWKKNWKNVFQQILVPLGYSDFDYHDPLIISNNKVQLDQFYYGLLNEVNKNISYDQIIINGIRDLINKKGWTEEQDYCPYCKLENFRNNDEFLRSLKTSLRGDLNRQIRRMQEIGEISLHSYSSDTIVDALVILPQFLEYHKQRWPNAYKAPGFHQKLLEYGLPLGIVDFTELRIGDQPVSWHLGFRDKGHYYYYMPVMNPEFVSFSPAKVHLLYLVNQSIREGFKIFDHLRGAENYKAGWTNEVQKLIVYQQAGNRKMSQLKNWLIKTKIKVIK